MAYYGILSIFPMFMIVFAVLELVGDADLPRRLAEYARDEGASGSLSDTIQAAARTALSPSGEAAGTAGAIGVVAMLYGASRAFTAAGRALDVVARRRSTARDACRGAREDLGWTVVVLAVASRVLLLTLVSGDVLTRTSRGSSASRASPVRAGMRAGERRAGH